MFDQKPSLCGGFLKTTGAPDPPPVILPSPRGHARGLWGTPPGREASPGAARSTGTVRCVRCGLPIPPGAPWHLDLRDDSAATSAARTRAATCVLPPSAETSSCAPSTRGGWPRGSAEPASLRAPPESSVLAVPPCQTAAPVVELSTEPGRNLSELSLQAPVCWASAFGKPWRSGVQPPFSGSQNSLRRAVLIPRLCPAARADEIQRGVTRRPPGLGALLMEPADAADVELI